MHLSKFMIWTLATSLAAPVAANATLHGDSHRDHSVHQNKMADSYDVSVLNGYLRIQEALAADRLDGVNAAAKDLVSKAGHVKDSHVAAFARIQEAAGPLQTVSTLEAAREHFKALSKVVVEWNRIARNTGVEEVHCTMAHGSWLQREGAVANPYYGNKMLSCGEKVRKRD